MEKLTLGIRPFVTIDDVVEPSEVSDNLVIARCSYIVHAVAVMANVYVTLFDVGCEGATGLAYKLSQCFRQMIVDVQVLREEHLLVSEDDKLLARV